MSRTSRRDFLKGAATAAGVTLTAKHSLGAGSVTAGRTKLSQFGYGDVELLEGPMREQFRTNHAFFLALSEDALLKPYRRKADMPDPGDVMGGWYNWSKEFDPPTNMTGYIPGHSYGQYLSSLARAYAVTGDVATKAKVERLVRGLGGAISPNFYREYPLPAYTSDKVTCGLIDAYTFAGDTTALSVLGKATDAVLPRLPDKALTRPEMAALPHPNIAWTWDESYTLPENLFLAWKRMGDRRYLLMAQRYLMDKHYFDPLAEGDNVLAGLHAYSHVNALSSAAQAWLVLGSEKHLRAAKNGFEFVRTTQSFATGGWGPNEGFCAPGSGVLGKSLTETHASFETPCGAYGHFKIARYLMRITGDSRYGDSMERVLYNTILGALPIQPDGYSFYYSDYNEIDAHKVYFPCKWPCCSGTFPQITADYGISSYFRDDSGVYVNLYVPSRVSWRQGSAHLALEQTTQYPYAREVALQLHADRAQTFAVHLRVPEWAGAATRIAVNGRAVSSSPQPGQFATIRREWKDGDRIEVEFDMPHRLMAVDAQHPNMVALMVGPVCLFALDPQQPKWTRAQLLAARQTGSGEWTAQGTLGAATFRSFPDIGKEQYRLYHEVEI
ncbi:MAG: beta-L-arabinofuranosidase domain-containing protein [Acidobacteriaceae bacterium]